VALLATDDLVLVVNGDSDIETIEQFIERAKESPINIGGTGSVNVDFIVPTLFAEKAGFEFDYVSFNSMSEQTTALLSNALDAMVGNPGEILGLIESATCVPLSSPARPRRQPWKVCRPWVKSDTISVCRCPAA
jgi:putative tricarboxylic transport membrane protein